MPAVLTRQRAHGASSLTQKSPVHRHAEIVRTTPFIARPGLAPCTLRRHRLVKAIRAAKKERELKVAPRIADNEETEERDDQPTTSSSSPPSSLPRGPTVKSSALSSGWKKALRPLANIKLAVAELTAIAVLSSIGTVIEQNKAPMFYVQNFPDKGAKVLGFLTYDIIFKFELDHIYSASYFLLLLAMLGASLIACTLTNQLPQVKVAQRWRFRTTEGSYTRLDVAKEVENARLDDLARLLVAKNYQIFVKRDGSCQTRPTCAGSRRSRRARRARALTLVLPRSLIFSRQARRPRCTASKGSAGSWRPLGCTPA